jgi:hypothetical protein
LRSTSVKQVSSGLLTGKHGPVASPARASSF